MSYFKDENQLYKVMQTLFDHMSDITPDPVDALVSSRMNIRINLTDPTAIINIYGRRRPVSIDYGTSNGRADLEIGMTADTLHLILLDKYSIKTGFSNGELKVRGPIWKALSLVDIFQSGRTFYPQVLKDLNMN